MRNSRGRARTPAGAGSPRDNLPIQPGSAALPHGAQHPPDARSRPRSISNRPSRLRWVARRRTSGKAVRAQVHGAVAGVGFRDATVERARGLGVLGWVRRDDDGAVRVHAEGGAEAVDALVAWLADGPGGARVEEVAVTPGKVEGHEQFAIRGVPAGAFAVRRRGDGRFELRLEVAGAIRVWAVPKEPSMDPAAKRFAIEVDAPGDDGPGDQVWDEGPYEQGGRVPWPEALDRGHAVFVLHGARLRGGFALQRTRPRGDRPQWLLVKRRDELAQPAA